MTIIIEIWEVSQNQNYYIESIVPANVHTGEDRGRKIYEQGSEELRQEKLYHKIPVAREAVANS